MAGETETNVVSVAIVGASVILHNVVDVVRLETVLPDPIANSKTLVLNFEARPGTGVDYVREHFGILPEVINAVITTR